MSVAPPRRVPLAEPGQTGATLKVTYLGVRSHGNMCLLFYGSIFPLFYCDMYLLVNSSFVVLWIVAFIFLLLRQGKIDTFSFFLFFMCSLLPHIVITIFLSSIINVKPLSPPKLEKIVPPFENRFL